MSLTEGDLLTVAQALRLMPVSRSAFYRLLDAGEIPSVRLGGVGGPRARVLVLRTDLERFIEQRRVAATGRQVARVNANDILASVRRRGST